MILAGVDAIDTRVGLNDLDVVGDRLVDVEGTQLRLVEARLKLVGYDHQPVLRRIESVFDALVAEVVHVRFGVVVARINGCERMPLQILVVRQDAFRSAYLVRECDKGFSRHLEL